MKSIFLSVMLSCFIFFGCKKASVRADGGELPGLKDVAMKAFNLGLWCDGLPVYGDTNTVTGRPDCNSGDSVLWGGLVYSVWPQESVKQGIVASIAEDGRPYRSHEHRIGGDDDSSFSRDMYLGFLAYCLKSKDAETCQKVVRYAVDHDYKLCPKSPDNACQLSPSVMYLTHAVWSENGWDTPNGAFEPSALEEGVEDADILQAAQFNELSYRTHLVSLKIWLYAKTGEMNEAKRQAAGILHKRQPQNLWYWYVAWKAGAVSAGDRDKIADKLVAMGSTWQPRMDIRRRDWIWQQGKIDLNEYGYAMGQDFGFLACEVSGGC